MGPQQFAIRTKIAQIATCSAQLWQHLSIPQLNACRPIPMAYSIQNVLPTCALEGNYVPKSRHAIGDQHTKRGKVRAEDTNCVSTAGPRLPPCRSIPQSCMNAGVGEIICPFAPHWYRKCGADSLAVNIWSNGYFWLGTNRATTGVKSFIFKKRLPVDSTVSYLCSAMPIRENPVAFVSITTSIVISWVSMGGNYKSTQRYHRLE